MLFSTKIVLEPLSVHLKHLPILVPKLHSSKWKDLFDLEWHRPPQFQLARKESLLGIEQKHLLPWLNSPPQYHVDVPLLGSLLVQPGVLIGFMSKLL